ncbi:Bug family tripartite tricarboxylate transporter substrate binding protein [Acidovorax sp. SDU_ACID1]|uniref:Bug family tripartite tricarboxylate transporter substrate binding protein n=1 Tax=Acidovorax sp. SDU_ACID1 TaxID=3136632 RepID=UPI003873BCBE
MKLLFKSLVCCLCTWLMFPTFAVAQDWPSRPITLVVPYSAGTGIDGLARALANNLGKSLGQPVIVENRPGAGTNIGTAAVARAKPDGYTLVIGANSSFAANKSLYRHLGFDPQADLTPVAFLGTGAMVVLATPASGIRSMEELVALAKSNPEKINFGAANTTARVWIELITSAAGIKAQTVLYSNAGTMLNDLVGGQIPLSVENTGTSRALVSSKKLIPLAVTSKTRGKFNATVPTLSELGITQLEVDPWFAVFAPKGMPSEIVKRLNAEINALQGHADYIRAKDFVEYAGGGWSPEELGAFQASEITKWRELVDRTGIRLD